MTRSQVRVLPSPPAKLLNISGILSGYNDGLTCLLRDKSLRKAKQGKRKCPLDIYGSQVQILAYPPHIYKVKIVCPAADSRPGRLSSAATDSAIPSVVYDLA